MNVTIDMCVAIIGLSIVAPMGFAQDGLVLPIDNHCTSNRCVSVKFISAKDDPALPQYMTIYKPVSDFITFGNEVSTCVKVDGKICIENYSNWTYEFGCQYMLTGYYCLEIDLMLDNGKIISMKKRRPQVLHEHGSSIKVKPSRKWESLVSFDRRLWDFSSEIGTNKITRLRPRFAFGAYNVDGIYYRTTGEVKKRTKILRRFDDRDGELIGGWVECTSTNVLLLAVECPVSGDNRGYWNADNRPGSDWQYTHEAGHLMGLDDDYVDDPNTGRSVLNHGHEHHMMAEDQGTVVWHEVEMNSKGFTPGPRAFIILKDERKLND